MQHQRWVVLAFVALSIVVGWTVQAGSVSAFGQFGIADTHIGPFNLTTAIALVVGGGTLFALLRNARAVQFTDEVVDELAKVTWPSREETVRASTTVVVTTLIVASILAVYDFVWKNLADLVLFSS